jgi:hypothetical protein
VTRSDHTEGRIQARRDFARGIERDVTGYSEAYQGGYAQGLKDGSFHAHEREVEIDRERRREAGLD